MDFKGLPNGANFILIALCVGELSINKVSSERECTIVTLYNLVPAVIVRSHWQQRGQKCTSVIMARFNRQSSTKPQLTRLSLT